MSHDFTTEEIELAKERLGLTLQALLFPFRALHMSIAQERLKELVDRTRPIFRQWLPRLHPDHNPDRPDLHRQFLCLAFVWSELKSLRDPKKFKQQWFTIQEAERKYASPFRTSPVFAKHGYTTTRDINATSVSDNSTSTGSDSVDAIRYGLFYIRPV